MEPTNHSNGMCLDNDGNLIACADEKNELWEITIPDKKVTVLLKDYQGKLHNGPNDVWVIPTGPLKGNMYITDPLYARQWWRGFRTNQPQQPGNYVYYVSADGKTIKPVITDMRTPNGIIGTPDGKTLYVSDYDTGPTNVYTINADGTLGDKKKFCDVGSDGMTIDSDGNITPPRATPARDSRSGTRRAKWSTNTPSPAKTAASAGRTATSSSSARPVPSGA